ncbi:MULTISPECIES: glycosyltransferase family 4 protein [Chryseobacterium]|uniref:Glycosyltransferase involved in cell wall biosynthesis n=2 Tax=Chryseobacterium TaxID=59732 RepID=A0ABU0TDI4_9FLAO|nr:MULTISPECIES: glycosyltransferase family 4 protein [Chryseobacterium]MDQ1095130.1 glycosyltransferase involved in cell wall biosynthesis [Chryseobacterium camelliae]MDQ1099067.1 glycosyltransferase involved in cell wall biosynthesis [Chryseobacterium sp. SORGH_AS_1048]MDR6086417.1 glycosyltransferase involved in cell wall biosynthesis [Chryseobacterium sp. SORGH_AS_0909]MDT3407079.1 glycosyltransferase involved in cell wall biosynthesis [Pseudacidovorax intermedius]
MNILIITQYFYPENFKSNDLAFELKNRGHNVTVLTGIPNYPEGKIFDGYGFFKNKKQVINGVRVIRSLLLPRGKGGGLRLFTNYYSFAFFASIKAFFLGINNRFDAIIVHEPSPITQYYPALLMNKLWKIPVYFWVMDLWPESLSIAGGIKNKFILNYYSKVIKNFYKNAEKLLVTSKGFRSAINEKGDFDDKIVYFPNWAEDSISDGNKDFPIPKMPDGFKVMFAGNIGEAQDLENIMKAAVQLKANKNIKFILVGDGRKMPFVKNFIEEHKLTDTVSVMGRFPVEAMSSFFDKADIMLVTLKDDPIFNLTVPAKLQAYMSASKPVIAMLNGEGAQNVIDAECGFVVAAGDYSSLAKTILTASELSYEQLQKLGSNSRKYYEMNFKMSACISNLESIISKEN